MGFSGFAAAVAAVSAVAGTTAAVVNGNKAAANARHAADMQQQARQETLAQQAQAQAEQQRQAIREERVKRARIEQSATNSGADSSSGELGALGSLGTQLGVNLGFGQGTFERSGRISADNQEAADSIFASQQNTRDAALDQQIGNTSSQVFSAAGGYKSIKNASIFNPTKDTSFDNPDNYG